MKKYFLVSMISLIVVSILNAQEYKVNKTAGKIILNLPSVTVEGYNGSQVIFSTGNNENESDPRAKGLRTINGSGFVDNTGLGLSVVEKGATLEVNQVASTNLDIKIQVPKNMIISFTCHNLSNNGKVKFKDLDNEIEISTDYNPIDLENVTGPVLVNSLYGPVDATFNDHVKGPVSIASIYSIVDVAIPVNTKANVNLSCSHGAILASGELNIILEKNNEDGMINYGNSVKGKLNGGGSDLKLTSEFGKIYLRKTK